MGAAAEQFIKLGALNFSSLVKKSTIEGPQNKEKFKMGDCIDWRKSLGAACPKALPQIVLALVWLMYARWAQLNHKVNG